MKVTTALHHGFRVAFIGALAVGLYYGVTWATDVEELADPLPRSVREGESRVIGASPTAEPSAAATPAADPSANASAAAVPTPTGPPPEELIAAARPPGQTSVQVLDAGGGQADTREAADVVADLGYQVVSVTSARAALAGTTIWFTGQNEPEAEALRARDGRFAEIDDNNGLSEGVDLHVLVADDWE